MIQKRTRRKIGVRLNVKAAAACGVQGRLYQKTSAGGLHGQIYLESAASGSLEHDQTSSIGLNLIIPAGKADKGCRPACAEIRNILESGCDVPIAVCGKAADASDVGTIEIDAAHQESILPRQAGV